MKIRVEVEVPDGELCHNCKLCDSAFDYNTENARILFWCFVFRNERKVQVESNVKKLPECVAAEINKEN